MTTDPSLPLAGQAAPPRLNGELAFDEPWQSRVFGLTAALAEAGTITWPDMQAALIERVGLSQNNTTYWSSWLAAVTDLLERQQAVDQTSLDAERHRLAELYAH